MNELTPKPVGGSLVGSILHGSSGNEPMPTPYSHPIFLLETFIAGTSHVENMRELSRDLVPEERLKLFRESKNEYDSNAIVVKNSAGAKLGYVPRVKNEVLARLLDGGKALYAVIQSVEPKDHWVKIVVKIFMQE
ncbi:MAG: HIRAN domain-containing protein [Thermoguttaceae bacterium]|nr:HIRAN domain-containing protein [Thermoguttaceae bacterium]